MANNRVVTELVIDARPSAAGAAEFERAMGRAEQAAERARATALGLRLDSNLPRSVDRVSAAYDKLRGSIDPVVKAQLTAEREMRRALGLVDRAVMQGVATEQQAGATISALRQKQAQAIDRVREAQMRLNATPVTPPPTSATGPAGAAAGGGTLLASRALLGPIAGALSVREVVGYGDAWTSAGNKIRAVSEITGVQARSLQELNDIATETRAGFAETVTLYSRLTLAAADVAKSEQEIADATEIVNKAFKAGGAAAHEQAAGILQLSQALGSGVLQGDELRSLRENAPLIAKAIADEFNTTIGGLKQLGADGELVAGRVFKAILKGEAEIEAAFEQTNATIHDGLTAIKNAGTELIGTLSDVTGGAGSLSGELVRFGQDLEKLSNDIDAFASNPSLRTFSEFFYMVQRGQGSGIADQLLDALPEATRSVQDLNAEIAATKQRIAELEANGALGPFRLHLENAKDDLKALQAELHAVEVAGHGAFAPLARSAEDSSMRALAEFRKIQAGLNGIQDKTVTVNVRTVTDVGGAQIGVTRHNIRPDGTDAPSGPTLKQINVRDFLGSAGFADGGFTGNMPANRIAGFVHGQEFVFDAETTRRIGVGNLEAIRRGVRGYETGGPVGSIAALAGGRDTLSLIEENTFRTVEELQRAVGYFEAMHGLEEAMLDALQDLAGKIGIASRGGSSGGFSGGAGGSSGGGFGGFSSAGGGGRVYSSNDPNAPYYYGGSVYPGGPQYDPVADALLNGNMGALKNLTASQIGSMYTATPTNIAGNYQDFNKMISQIIKNGPQLGTYGGGINITADSDWVNRSGFFAGGFNSGGMIHPGDTQRVEFFKSPQERVIIARPDQFEDRRGGGERTVSKKLEVTINMPRSGPVTPQTRQADAEAADRFRQAVRAELAGL